MMLWLPFEGITTRAVGIGSQAGVGMDVEEEQAAGAGVKLLMLSVAGEKGGERAAAEGSRVVAVEGKVRQEVLGEKTGEVMPMEKEQHSKKAHSAT